MAELHELLARYGSAADRIGWLGFLVSDSRRSVDARGSGTVAVRRALIRLDERGFTVARAKTDVRTATAAARVPKSLSQPANVTHSDVARRAYDLYLARGCEHGHDVDDWMQAERELRAPSTTA
jgi:DUF2934 family protein